MKVTEKLALLLLPILLLGLCGVAEAYNPNLKEAEQEGYESGINYTKNEPLRWFNSLSESEVKETAGVRAFRNNYLLEGPARGAWIKGWLNGYFFNYSIAIRRGY